MPFQNSDDVLKFVEDHLKNKSVDNKILAEQTIELHHFLKTKTPAEHALLARSLLSMLLPHYSSVDNPFAAIIAECALIYYATKNPDKQQAVESHKKYKISDIDYQYIESVLDKIFEKVYMSAQDDNDDEDDDVATIKNLSQSEADVCLRAGFYYIFKAKYLTVAKQSNSPSHREASYRGGMLLQKYIEARIILDNNPKTAQAREIIKQISNWYNISVDPIKYSAAALKCEDSSDEDETFDPPKDSPMHANTPIDSPIMSSTALGANNNSTTGFVQSNLPFKKVYSYTNFNTLTKEMKRTHSQIDLNNNNIQQAADLTVTTVKQESFRPNK